MSELDHPVLVDFPLHGEWVAAHTPAHRIPSHGTDRLGQRYAYDFLRVDERRGMHFFKGSLLSYWLVGVPTSSSYCWHAPVFAPFDADVVVSKDGLSERARLHPVGDVMTVVLKTIAVNVKARLCGVRNIDLHKYLGNHIILQRGDIFAFFAHLCPRSVAVRKGQTVRAGDVLARVGHTGISTAPHLHFQVMDSADLLTARGIPCAFRSYQVYDRGRWRFVNNGIPDFNERIRYK